MSQGTYDLAGIYGPQLDSLESILEDSNLNRFDRLVEPLPERLTQEMLAAFDSRKEQIRSSLEEAILSRFSLLPVCLLFLIWYHMHMCREKYLMRMWACVACVGSLLCVVESFEGSPRVFI